MPPPPCIVPTTPPMMSRHDDDVAVVQRLRVGDMGALAVIFERYSASLLRLATGLTRSSTEADEVVQDVFVGLSLALRGYAEHGAFAAWLRGVTVRTALARRRRLQLRREVPLPSEFRERAVVASTETRVMLDDALHRLPAAQHDVFVLKVVEGYSHAEIGQLLGIKPGTSEVRLHRAIRRLRHILSEKES